jgi:hypothetical protein
VGWTKYTQQIAGKTITVEATGPPTQEQWQGLYDDWAAKNKTVGGVHKLLGKGEAAPSISQSQLLSTEEEPSPDDPTPPTGYSGLLPLTSPTGRQVMDIRDPETGLFPAMGEAEIMSVDQQEAAGLISFEDDEPEDNYTAAVRAAIEATNRQAEEAKKKAADEWKRGAAARMENLGEDVTDRDAQEALAEELRLFKEQGGNPVLDAIIDTAGDGVVETGKWMGRITTRLPLMIVGGVTDPVVDMYNTFETWKDSAKLHMSTVGLDNLKELRLDPDITAEQARRIDWKIAKILDDRREVRDDIAKRSLRIIGHLDNFEKDLQQRADGSGFWGTVVSTTGNLMTDATDTFLGMGHLLVGDVLGFDETPYEEASTGFFDWVHRTLETGYTKGADVTSGAAGAAFALAGSIPRAFIPEGEHDIGLDVVIRGNPGLMPQALESRPLTTFLFLAGPFRSARDRYVAAGQKVPWALDKAAKAADKMAELTKATLLRSGEAVGIDKFGRARVNEMVAEMQRSVGDSHHEVNLNAESAQLGNALIRGPREVYSALLDLSQEAANLVKNKSFLSALDALDEAGLVLEFNRLMGRPPLGEGVKSSKRTYDRLMYELVARTSEYWRQQGRHPNAHLVPPEFSLDLSLTTPRRLRGDLDPIRVPQATLIEMVRGYLQDLRRREADRAARGEMLETTREMAYNQQHELIYGPLPERVKPPQTDVPWEESRPVATLSTKDADGNPVWNAAMEFGEASDFGRPLPGQRNRWGIYDHEWDRFVAQAPEWVPELRATGINADTPPHLLTRAASYWYNRAEHDAPLAAVVGGLHRFTPIEALDWARNVFHYMDLGRSLSKAEYLAYRDTLRRRGMNVTEDARSLGLSVPGDERVAPGSLADAVPGDQAGYADAGKHGTINNNQNVLPPRPTTRTLEEAVADFNAQLDRSFPQIGGRDRFESHVLDASRHRKIVEEIQRITGEEPTPRRQPTPLEQAVNQQPLPPELVGRAELPPGGKYYVPEGMVDWTPTGAQRTLGLEPTVLLPAEFLGKVNRIARRLGMPAEPIASAFAELLDWRSGKALASEGARRKLMNRFVDTAKREGYLSELPRAERRRQLQLDKNKLEGMMNSLRAGRPMEAPVIPRVFRDGAAFNVKTELQGLLMEQPKLMDLYLQDAVVNAGAALADEAASAHVKNVFRQYRAAANPSAESVAVNIERRLQAGEPPVPAVLRVHPDVVTRRLVSRRKGQRPTFMPEGKRADRVLTPNDTLAVQMNLSSYRPLSKEMREWVGLIDEADQKQGGTWVSQGLYDNIAIEMLAQDAIRQATWIDRISRSSKRGLVALSAATTLGNFQSDYVMASVQQGSMFVGKQIGDSALYFHQWRKGRVERAADVDRYDMTEALVGTGLVDATLLEPEGIGMQNHKGALVLVENAAARLPFGGRPARNAIRRSGEFVEKWWNKPTLRAFRASTNAFKIWRAEKAFNKVRGYVDDEAAGAVFSMEVYPNVWKKFEKSTGADGQTVILSNGKPLTRQQWFQQLARMAKVTSDRLFFDYSDASLFAKGGRAVPGLRALGGSLFYMWLYKSIYLPGIKRGLLQDAYKAGPAYRSSNPQVRLQMADEITAARMKTVAMAQGARAAADVPGNAELLEKMGFNRREYGAHFLQFTGRPDMVAVYNAGNMNVFEGQALVMNLLTSTGVDFANAIGVFDGDDGELAKLYPTDKKSGNPSLGLEDIQDPDERKWIKQMRELVAKNSSAGLVTGKDYLRAVGLAGGPLLEALVQISNDDRAQRTTDMNVLWRKLGKALLGANSGRLIEVAIAAVDPSSEATSFVYTIRDPRKFLKAEPGERHRQTMQWVMRTVMTRTWREEDLRKQGLERYADQWEEGFTQTIIAPFQRAIADAVALGNKEKERELIRLSSMYQIMISDQMREIRLNWKDALDTYNRLNEEAVRLPPTRRRPKAR